MVKPITINRFFQDEYNMITEEVVDNLEGYDGVSSLYRGDIIPNSLNIKMFGYYDHQNLLNIAIENKNADFQPININGMSVLHQQIDTQNQGSLSVLVFTCRNNAFKSYFIKIVNEILNKTSCNGSLDKNTPYVIENWLYFLELPVKDKLTPDQVLGLIGELLSLENFCRLGVSIDRVIDAWQGPFGSKRDFMFENIDIEVKVSAKQSGHLHKISSLEQLSFEEDEKVFLYSWNIYRDRSERSNNIVDIINRINAEFVSTPSQLSEFNSRLYEVGFDLRDSDDYVEDRFQISSSFICFIEEGFPRITSDSFKDGLSKRIRKIEYEIDLNGFKEIGIKKVVSEI